MRRKNIWLMAILMLISLSLLNSKNASGDELDPQKPMFSKNGGLYTEEFELTISFAKSDKASNMILYTLDGSTPELDNPSVHEYTEPLRIGYIPLRENPSRYFCGTVIRARAFTPDGNGSETMTATYFVDRDIFKRYQLPIVAVTTDPDNLYDPSIGIMAAGNTGKRGKEWERPIHFEYFDENGKLQVSMGAGIRLHGGASRGWAIKSLRIYARDEYDVIDQIEYDFFSDSPVPALVRNGNNTGKPITEFKRLILRSGGNEGVAGDGTMFRDALTHALMVNTSLDLQAYSPAVAFINGEYYGNVNIRERQDEEYIEDHYNVKEEDVVIYEFSYNGKGEQIPDIVEGEESDLEFYNNMLDFIRNNDLSVPENYEQVKKWMDVENFADYQIVNIYGANRDWPGNNCKAWRIRTEYNPDAPYGLDGRIRWLLYDADFNFGLYKRSAYTDNSLQDALRAGGTAWPTQDGATLLLRKLLENKEFKTYFCQRFLDLINTEFDVDYVHSLIDILASYYEASIQEHRDKYFLWGDWYDNVATVKTFIQMRGAICKMHLADRFSLGKIYFLSLDIGTAENPIGGYVRVNTVDISSSSKGVKEGIWRKSFYDGLSTILTAVPEEGYEFVGWSGTTDSSEISIDATKLFTGNGDVALKPVFKPVKTSDASNDAEDNSASETSGMSSNNEAADNSNTDNEGAGSNKADKKGKAENEASNEDKASNTSGLATAYVIISALVLAVALAAAYIIFRNKKRGTDN
jgi:hypothetical protein